MPQNFDLLIRDGQDAHPTSDRWAGGGGVSTARTPATRPDRGLLIKKFKLS
jgi:hypothetical protein